MVEKCQELKLNVNCGRERVRINDELVGKQESYIMETHIRNGTRISALISLYTKTKSTDTHTHIHRESEHHIFARSYNQKNSSQI